MSEPNGRSLHAAGHLLIEWRHVCEEEHLSPQERLDGLAIFVRAILDRGDGTWAFPPNRERTEHKP